MNYLSLIYKLISKLKKKINLLVTVLVVFSFLTSCSYLSSKENVNQTQNEFNQSLKQRSNISTVPIEVASEFNDLVLNNNVELPSLTKDEELRNPFDHIRKRRKAIRVYETNDKETEIDTVTDNDLNSSEDDSDEILIEGSLKSVSKKNKSTVKSQLVKKSNKSLLSRTAASQSSAEKIDKTYIVKSGDTLMKISFNQFGDIFKWKKILNDNQNIISNKNLILPGTEILIKGEKYILIEKNGLPYLIKKDDTLTKISGLVYGDKSKWPVIWKNNPQLIRDPNKIYQGFTLYYPKTPHLSAVENHSNESINTKSHLNSIRKVASTSKVIKKSSAANLKLSSDQPESLKTKEE